MDRRLPIEHVACSRLGNGHEGQGLGWKGHSLVCCCCEKGPAAPGVQAPGCDVSAARPRASHTQRTGTLAMSPCKPTGISGSYASCEAACTPTQETIRLVPVYNSTVRSRHFQTTSYFVLKTCEVKEGDFYLSPKRCSMRERGSSDV